MPCAPTNLRRAILIACAVLLARAVNAAGPTLTVHDASFAIDGKDVFLLGCSYYGALGVDNEEYLRDDLDDLRNLGFNWIRVWATWNFDEVNVSAVTPDGTARGPYMQRLKHLCEIAGQRGMIVDVTVTRGKPPMPTTHNDHIAVMKTLATALKPYRNVYIDIANERDVGDERHVPDEQVAELVRVIKQIDPSRLCTASCVPDVRNVADLLASTDIDFVAPHLSRTPKSPAKTAPYCRDILHAMRTSGHVVPIHLQEPFRRGYTDWQPNADDFKADLVGALEGGAAGWCFHNGSTRGADGQRPRRSFDMRSGEGRLFAQLDDEEKRFMEALKTVDVQSAYANR